MKRTLNCENCNKVFSTYKKNGKYCSQECYRSHGVKKPRPYRAVKRIKSNCQACGKEFEYKETNVKKYCSFRCYRDKFRSLEVGEVAVCKNCRCEFEKKHNGQTVCSKECSIENLIKSRDGEFVKERKCAHCEKTFKPRNNKIRYCSKECFDDFNSSKRKVECIVCGKLFKRRSVANVLCSLECRAKASTGENNATFTGYITQNNGYLRYTPYHPEYPNKYVHQVIWEEANPNGVCNRCGGMVEHIHHIDRDKQNNLLSNLEGLCAPCHMKEHEGEKRIWSSKRL